MCTSAEKAEIDGALIEGVSGREVARRFGLSKSAVGRHRNGCLAPRIAAAARIVAPVSAGRAEAQRAKAIASGGIVPSADDVLGLAGLVDRIGRSLARLDGAAEAAYDGKSHAALAALSAQLHRGVEVVAKLQNITEPDGAQVRYTVVFNLGRGVAAAAIKSDEND